MRRAGTVASRRFGTVAAGQGITHALWLAEARGRPPEAGRDRGLARHRGVEPAAHRRGEPSGSPSARAAASWRRSSPVLGAQTRGIWLGWDGGLDVPPDTVAGLPIDLHGVPLSRGEVERYYHGFVEPDALAAPARPGRAARPSTTATGTSTAPSTSASPSARTSSPTTARCCWVHDYHLMLRAAAAPARAARRGRIGFFLHVPFPPPEVCARLPWREQLIDGLLGADARRLPDRRVPRQLRPHVRCSPARRRRWRDGTALRLADGRVVDDRRAPDLDRRRRLSPQRARGPASARALDRLRDAVPRPARAARRRPARLHEGHPRAAARVRAPARAAAATCAAEVALVQIAVPSRGDIREYRELRAAGRAARRPHQRPLHRARAATCPSTTCTAASRPDQLLASTGSPTSAS